MNYYANRAQNDIDEYLNIDMNTLDERKIKSLKTDESLTSYLLDMIVKDRKEFEEKYKSHLRDKLEKEASKLAFMHEAIIRKCIRDGEFNSICQSGSKDGTGGSAYAELKSFCFVNSTLYLCISPPVKNGHKVDFAVKIQNDCKSDLNKGYSLKCINPELCRGIVFDKDLKPNETMLISLTINISACNYAKQSMEFILMNNMGTCASDAPQELTIEFENN
jgi:hypothetical protein